MSSQGHEARVRYESVTGTRYELHSLTQQIEQGLEELELAYANLAAAQDKKEARACLRQVSNLLHDERRGIVDRLEAVATEAHRDERLLGYLLSLLHVLGPRLAAPALDWRAELNREPTPVLQLLSPEEAVRRILEELRTSPGVALAEESRFGPFRIGARDQVLSLLESGRVDEGVALALSDPQIERSFLDDVYFSKVAHVRKEGGYLGGFTFWHAVRRDQRVGTQQRLDRQRWRIEGAHRIIAEGKTLQAKELREAPKDLQIVGDLGEVALPPVASFPNLKILVLVSAKVKGLDAIAQCAGLKHLVLGHEVDAADLLFLRGAAMLEHVVIDGCALRTLEGLSGFRKLKLFALRTSERLSLSGMGKLPKLGEVRLTAPAFDDLAVLVSLPVKRLELEVRSEFRVELGVLARSKTLDRVVVRGKAEPGGLSDLGERAEWEIY